VPPSFEPEPSSDPDVTIDTQPAAVTTASPASGAPATAERPRPGAAPLDVVEPLDPEWCDRCRALQPVGHRHPGARLCSTHGTELVLDGSCIPCDFGWPADGAPAAGGGR
jgi:hypothetical protein